MKFSVAALFTAVVSTVYAQTAANAGVAINLPSFGQVITAGTTFTITWTVDTNSSSSTTINSIALMKGDSAVLQTYISDIISAPISVSPSSYDWAIPSNVETGPSYVLAFAGNNGATTYSTYFTIIGAAPGTSNSTTLSAAVASSTATSGSAVSGSVSGSASKSTASSSSTSTSGANTLKAGLVGAAGVAVAALLL